MRVHDAPRLKLAVFGNAVDAAGTQLQMVTLDLIAVAYLNFSAMQVGLLNALQTAAYLFLSVPLGLVVDVRGPFIAGRVSALLKLLVSAIAVFLLVSGRLNVYSAMAVALGLGISTVLMETGQTSLVAHLTSRTDEVLQSVARMASADRVASIVVPAVVGFAVARRQATWTMMFGLLLLALSWIAWEWLRRVTPGSNRAVRKNSEVRTRVDVLTGLFDGFRVISSNRTLVGVLLLVMAGNIGLAIADSVESILVIRNLGLSTSFYGILGAIGASSGVVSSMFAPRLIRKVSLRAVFAWGGIAQAVVALLPLLAMVNPSLAPALLIVFALSWGAVVTVSNISGSAYAAASVRKDVLGRTSAASRMITMGCVPVAAFAGGALADNVGIWAPLSVWPVLTTISAAIFIALSRVESAAGSSDSGYAA